MNERFCFRVPKKNLKNEFLKMVRKKYNKINGAVGKECCKALQLYLEAEKLGLVKDDSDYENLIDYLKTKHTHIKKQKGKKCIEKSNSENKNRFLEEILPENCKNKRDRAYCILQYLMKCYEYEFKFKNFKNIQNKLFGHSDDRTTKSNLNLLIMDKRLNEIQMRLKKDEIDKKRYEFSKNYLFDKYNSSENLNEFSIYFKEKIKGRYQLTFENIKDEINIFQGSNNDYFVNSDDFVKIRIQHLIEKNIIKEVVKNKIYTILSEENFHTLKISQS